MKLDAESVSKYFLIKTFSPARSGERETRGRPPACRESRSPTKPSAKNTSMKVVKSVSNAKYSEFRIASLSWDFVFSFRKFCSSCTYTHRIYSSLTVMHYSL